MELKKIEPKEIKNKTYLGNYCLSYDNGWCGKWIDNPIRLTIKECCAVNDILMLLQTKCANGLEEVKKILRKYNDAKCLATMQNEDCILVLDESALIYKIKIYLFRKE